MHVHRDAAAVVADGNRAIHMDRDLDLVAIAGEMFVDRVVQHLEDAVMQPRSSGSPMYMPGRLRTASKPFQLVDLRRIVFLRRVGVGIHLFFGFQNVFLRHKNPNYCRGITMRCTTPKF